MKTIGMLGGMSWESSLEYYRIINQAINQRLGGLHSAKCVIVSVDFAEIEKLQSNGDWEEATRQMISAAQQVERAGADFLIICTNTMHKMAEQVQQEIQIPLLHIADTAARQIKAQGLQTVGLLGTRFTMEQNFYRERLEQNGLKVVVPSPGDRGTIHDIIYNELVLGQIRQESRQEYLRIISRLPEVEGVILGCTEIGLLVKQSDCRLPLFDTTEIHAAAAVDYALSTFL